MSDVNIEYYIMTKADTRMQVTEDQYWLALNSGLFEEFVNRPDRKVAKEK